MRATDAEVKSFAVPGLRTLHLTDTANTCGIRHHAIVAERLKWIVTVFARFPEDELSPDLCPQAQVALAPLPTTSHPAFRQNRHSYPFFDLKATHGLTMAIYTPGKQFHHQAIHRWIAWEQM